MEKNSSLHAVFGVINGRNACCFSELEIWKRIPVCMLILG